jgi:hypothetical protein
MLTLCGGPEKKGRSEQLSMNFRATDKLQRTMGLDYAASQLRSTQHCASTANSNATLGSRCWDGDLVLELR